MARLVFLRGRDADGRLRELAAGRAALRPVLGALAVALVDRRGHEALGYRCLGDYGRERLGVGARALRGWARVWRELGELPRLRDAVLAGEVGWSVAARVVGRVSPETEAACLATVRGRTVRAVEAILKAVRAAEGEGNGEAGGGAGEAGREGEPAGVEGADAGDRVEVRLACSAREAGLWHAAVELARRVAGEALPVWACAEAVAAEAASALGAGEGEAEVPALERSVGRPRARVEARENGGGEGSEADTEDGRRERAFPRLSWALRRGGVPGEITVLAEGLEDCPALEIDARLCQALAFAQGLDFELGRVLRQVVGRGLHRELGFGRFDRYVRERLDVSPRTARRLMALARAEHRAPAVATAFRRGRLHAFQAGVLARVARAEDAAAWVKRARAVSFRRLEEDAEAWPRVAIVFRAPPEVARFFLAILRRAGSLERLLAHAILTWTELGRSWRDTADFARDGWRCTVPGCTARRNLQSHHLVFRSAGGPDAPWNRTTLCAFHHLRGVHAGVVRIYGRAPDELIYEFGNQRFRSGDVRA